MTDQEIDVLKTSDEAFFNLVYGGAFGREELGNINPGDGFRYVGRGPLQLTGRANYQRYAQRLGVDLLGNPDLVNDPEIGCRVAVSYMLDRYKGGGWASMKRAVGNAVATTEDVKDAAYARFLASGEFGGWEV